MRKRILVNALSVGLGGGRSYIINFLREIGRDDRGFDFTVLALEGQLDGIDRCGVPIEEVAFPGPGALRTPLRVLYEQTVLPRRARGFDLLFCAADIVPLVCRTPVVVLRRNLNIYDRSWDDNPRTRTLARIARAGARVPRRSVFPSRTAADRIREFLAIPEECVAVVHYGIDAAAFVSRAPASRDGGALFMPANPEPHKNIATAIRALALLPGERLQIVGESLTHPTHHAELTALARELGVDDRVELVGRVPYAEMLGFYSRAKALVFPSFHETFGHPLLEAMLAGTPIVASDISTFRELADDVALFHPPEDGDALAACVRALDDDPDATAERVERGRERAARFTWQRSFDELCAVFDSVLAG